jgi:hypothetical protein
MRFLRNMFLAAMMVLSFGIPNLALGQPGRVIYTVCRKFVVDRNCYKCSNYFAVRSESEAQAKCSRWGADEDPYYFPSVGRVFSWKLPNCTCDSDDENP